MVDLIPPAGTYLGVLSIDEVLFDYEGPRIFTARSTSNRLFYAYIVDEDEDEATETYVYLPLSDVRWAQIRSGRLGLRAAVERPEDGFVFIVTADYGAGRSAVREASPADLDPRWLPTEAAVLNLATPTRPDFSTQELGRIAVQEHRVQVEVEFDGEVYEIPADPIDWEVSTTEAFEQGKVVTAIRQLLGPEQWKAVSAKRYRNRQFRELFDLLAEAGGFDNSGN